MKLTRNDQTIVSPAIIAILALFVCVVALLGGSSRPDAVQIIALRPLTALFLIPAIMMLKRERIAELRAPLIFLSLLALWMVLQLIPLPTALWQALPGRGPIADVGAQLGQDNVWRPISMVPTRTINALASLIVPFAALMVFAAARGAKSLIFVILAGLGSLNALLGILQVIGERNSPLFFYEITNFGSAVGFFANHNHSAVFSSLTLVVIAYLATRRRFGFVQAWLRLVLAALYLLVLLAALVGLSRAGFLTTILAVLVSGLLFLVSEQGAGKVRHKVPQRPGINPVWAIMGLAAAVLGAVVVFVMFDRIPALNRITEAGTFEDLRWSLLPTLGEMIGRYWMFGSGFGSFEQVYHIHEPTALMLSSYLNQAHNDWAQWIIEGGLPAILVLGAFLVWLARGLGEMWRDRTSDLARPLFWLTIFGIIMFASMADYPLRTPLFQMAAVWLVALFACDRDPSPGA